MKLNLKPSMRALCSAILCCTALIAATRGQESRQPSRDQAVDEDVVRISTELVQTDAMVFDKAGRFVDGLQKDQFELLVDGKPQPISFFDRVRAGSSSEAAQLAAAARGRVTAAASTAGEGEGAATSASVRGRTIFFIVDDLHLALENIENTRRLLLHFIDEEMGQNDQAAIISTSGDLGLLQQLTGDKVVLRAAVARIKFRSQYIADMETPMMSEFQAFNIIERNHGATLGYFVELTMREYFITNPSIAASLVISRARAILQKSVVLTLNTLSSLELLVRSTEQVPGRKLLFFVSDGFYLTNTQTTDVKQRMRRITDAAARAGAVIYTLDARGLFSGMPDASSALTPDLAGLRSSATSGQISASQEPLRTLAAETGGRALVNTNALEAGLDKILEETSAYYIIAWRPSEASPHNPKYRRIEASIRGRPDLTVRMRKGFFTDARSATAKQGGKASAATPDDELVSALRSFYPRRTLPVLLSAGYINDPAAGMVLTALLEVTGEGLDASSEDAAAPQHNIDALIAVFDDKDKYISGFKQQLVIKRTGEKQATQPVRAFYNRQFHLAPGLYQVRVAARDTRDGRTGSAIEWVEIPDLSRGRFYMSSLFIGERSAKDDKSGSNASDRSNGSDGSNGNRSEAGGSGNRVGGVGGSGAGNTNAGNKDAADSMPFRPRRLISRGSRLGFMTYVYNAAQGGARGPDVALRIQVFRDDRPVIAAPSQKVKTDAGTDLKRIPYAAEIDTSRLPSGRYVLQVTATDLASKNTASQQVSFEIE